MDGAEGAVMRLFEGFDGENIVGAIADPAGNLEGVLFDVEMKQHNGIAIFDPRDTVDAFIGDGAYWTIAASVKLAPGTFPATAADPVHPVCLTASDGPRLFRIPEAHWLTPADIYGDGAMLRCDSFTVERWAA